jgi:beta-glucosidase
VFRDPKQPVETRIDDLIAHMTLEEKVSFLKDRTPAIPRLGIAAYNCCNEALHGVNRPGPATVFPESIGLAATWDPARVKAMADAISDEARAKLNTMGERWDIPYSGLLAFYSPVVNLARDPRWGRTQETYGEDPYLSGQIGTAYVQGLQGDNPRYLKAIATPKHFAVYSQETDRFSTNASVPEDQLWNYYLAPFRDLIVDGHAGAIMTSYTAINGVPSSANSWLLKDVLRDKWHFNGYVVSDEGAVGNVFLGYHYSPDLEGAITASINSGLDMVLGGSSPECCEFLQSHLLAEVQQKIISEKTLNRALSDVLRARFRLGLFDPPDEIPFSRLPASANGSPAHVELARQLARESIVLLKNDKSNGLPLLPLDLTKVRTIAVVGPNAAVSLFGGYSGIPANPPVTPVAGIRDRAKSSATVELIPWNPGFPSVPSEYLRTARGEEGLSGEYFGNDRMEGQALLMRVDAQVHFADWGWTIPVDAMQKPQYSVRWRGYLVPKLTGDYALGINVGGDGQLVLDGAPLVQGTDGEFTKTVHLEAAHSYAVTLEYSHKKSDSSGVRLIWNPPAIDIRKLSQYDAVIAVLGMNTDYEDETKDRTTIALPSEQQEFIEQVVRANPRTIVIVESGSVVDLRWIQDHVPAILEAWYPGEQGGNAIADVLFGDYNPAGRLPLTFYASDAQLPPMSDFDISNGRTYMYLNSQPLYSFGYGLSYASFRYANLKIGPDSVGADGLVHLSLTVENTGQRDGDEVVQAYVRPPKRASNQPQLQLKAFQRIHLQAGERRVVNLELRVSQWACWDNQKKKFVVAPGLFEIEVGASAADIRQTGKIKVVPAEPD